MTRPEIDITASGELAVFLPGRVVDPKRPNHRPLQGPMTFPATEEGLEKLVKTLQAWDETAPPSGIVGPLPRPSNEDLVEDWLQAGNKVTRPSRGVKPDIADLLKEIEELDV